jgi:ABC-2 type transport system permease protein
MRAWSNPNLDSRWFVIPGIIGMLTLVVSMQVAAPTVAREREQGTIGATSLVRAGWLFRHRMY